MKCPGCKLTFPTEQEVTNHLKGLGRIDQRHKKYKKYKHHYGRRLYCVCCKRPLDPYVKRKTGKCIDCWRGHCEICRPEFDAKLRDEQEAREAKAITYNVEHERRAKEQAEKYNKGRCICCRQPLSRRRPHKACLKAVTRGYIKVGDKWQQVTESCEACA